MGRRFPTPIIGVQTDEKRHEIVVRIATEAPEPYSQAAYIEQCQQRITKDGSNAYSESYLKRMLSSYAEIGVIEEIDDHIHSSPFAEEWLTGDLGFADFLWKSLKRSWVAMGKKPEGIEGLKAIVRTLEQASDGLTKGDIESQLSEKQDYAFNKEGIRGYPDVLILLGVIQKEGHTYTLADAEVVDRYKRRFRSANVFRVLEARLRREGSAVTPPSNEAKRDLMKYYMYREAGGWGKRRQWFKTFWRDYLQTATRKGATGSELRINEQYRSERNRKRRLKTELFERYDSIDSEALSGLSTSVLDRMVNADTEVKAQQIRISAGSGVSRADLELLANSDQDAYTLADGFELYDWQKEAAEQWFHNGDSRSSEEGIAQVVTGAGKTVMALEVIRRWLQEHPERVVTIIVPTNVLMQQWLTELVSALNVPVEDIGWAGGGHKDDFEGCRILVSIINSAVQDDYLQDILHKKSPSDHLLIADECHRYTGETFSNVFDYPRTASLGLSATPISRETEDVTEGDKLLLQELGDIYYELTYDEGIKRGLIPEFTVEYIGFDLAPQERHQYETLSRKVSDAVKDIRQQYEHRLMELSGSFAQKLHTIQNNTDGPTPAIADYFEYTQERRELVDNAVARQAITHLLLTEAVEADNKTIVFQERIEQLNQLIAPHETLGKVSRTGELGETAKGTRSELYEKYEGLEQADQNLERFFEQSDVWPVMYHSGHSRSIWNEFAMAWFREDNMANVMYSVKALVEGVDVPSADVGIVRVSSSNIRQRIQTLGRILRTGENASRSTLHVLYARDTVDERIFHEYDWDSELASAQVQHSIWEFESDTVYHKGKRRDAEPDEFPERPERMQVPDPDDLEFGDYYSGPREPIYQVSVDSEGRLFEKKRNSRQYVETSDFEAVIDFVIRTKGGGTLIINEHNHLLTTLPNGPVFLGEVDGPDIFKPIDENSGAGTLTGDPDELEDIFG